MVAEVENIPPRKSNVIRDLVSGKALSKLMAKHRGYLLFLFGLAVAYMALQYYMEKTVHEVRQLEQEVTSLRIEYTIRSSEFMTSIRRSKITRDVGQRNMEIREPQYPPKRIKMD